MDVLPVKFYIDRNFGYNITKIPPKNEIDH